MPKLTKTRIEKLEPLPDRDVWVWDDEVKGFAIRVRPSGERYFYLQKRVPGGRSFKKTIGRFPEVSVEDARETARGISTARANPVKLAEAIRPPSAKTVADLAEAYRAARGERLQPSTAALYDIYWDAHILPALGKVRLEELTRLHCESFHGERGASKTSRNRALKLLRQAIRAAMRWGGDWPKLPENPAAEIALHREQKVERILDPAASRRLIAELSARTDADPANATAWLLLLLALTGLRSSEWRLAEWSWIRNGLLHLPRTKAGPARDVYLDDLVLDILRRMPRRGRFVFPNEEGTAPIGKPKSQWVGIKRACGIDPAFRVHDLRHTFASRALVDAGLSLKEVAELLGHHQVSTTNRYLHLLDEQKLRAASAATAAVLGRGKGELRADALRKRPVEDPLQVVAVH